MKPLRSLRWRLRIRAVWHRIERARSDRRVRMAAAGFVDLSLHLLAGMAAGARVRAIHNARRQFEESMRAQAQAQANARRQDELARRAWRDGAIDV